LQHLIIKNEDPLEFINSKLPLDDIKRIFLEKLNAGTCKNVNIQDLFDNAARLNLHQPYKDALENLYADSLKNASSI